MGSSVLAIGKYSSATENHALIKVLIFSGKNNHEWQKTTPMLIRIFNQAKLFKTTVTERPDTLTYARLIKYDLILSNWNTWPDNQMKLSGEWERGFEKYVNEGGGALFFHAGGSSFYGWENYHRIGIGRWGAATKHGRPTKGRVYGFDQNHPITKGFNDFNIVDELWENTDIYPGVKSLGSLTGVDEKDGHKIDFPAIFVNQSGKGRSFFTILGHDERALLNTGLQTLLLRAAQWCARKEVTVEVPSEIKVAKVDGKDQFGWCQTDTTIGLSNHSGVVWQFNFNDRFGKPYFHPLNVGKTTLTCVAPPDHAWHLGLWFSWKYINGVNYWEYMNDYKTPETGYRSEGVTELQIKEFVKNKDFSADVRLKLNYHPIKGAVALSEERSLYISSPLKDGSYYIDNESLFKALSDSVILDRTPILGEQGGQSWGGYAGLSIRFNQDFNTPEIISEADSTKFWKGNWFFMGFNTLSGGKVGFAMMQHPKYTTNSTSWYAIKDPKIPFFYYSPAALFDSKIILKKGETLRLKYRVWVLPGTEAKQQLQEKFVQYLKNVTN
jgi:type 1 glutamine amidotransferase